MPGRDGRDEHATLRALRCWKGQDLSWCAINFHTHFLSICSPNFDEIWCPGRKGMPPWLGCIGRADSVNVSLVCHAKAGDAPRSSATAYDDNATAGYPACERIIQNLHHFDGTFLMSRLHGSQTSTVTHSHTLIDVATLRVPTSQGRREWCHFLECLKAKTEAPMEACSTVDQMGFLSLKGGCFVAVKILLRFEIHGNVIQIAVSILVP